MKFVLKGLVIILLSISFICPKVYYQFLAFGGGIGIAYLGCLEFEKKKVLAILCAVAAMLLTPAIKINHSTAKFANFIIILSLIVWLLNDLYLNTKNTKPEKL